VSLFSSAAAVLIVVLIILVLILVLVVILVSVLILIAVLILVIHISVPPKICNGMAAEGSLSRSSGFILCFEENTCNQSCRDCGCDTTCRSFQATGENPEKTFAQYGFLNAFGQSISKTRQRN